MFAKTYLETINPKSSYKRLLKIDVFLSIFVHLTLYMSIIYILDFIFNINFDKKKYSKIAVLLTLVMILGYIGRLLRAKQIHTQLSKIYPKNVDINLKTVEFMNSGYLTWYFLG